jgi:hypothetical protein
LRKVFAEIFRVGTRYSEWADATFGAPGAAGNPRPAAANAFGHYGIDLNKRTHRMQPVIEA